MERRVTRSYERGSWHRYERSSRPTGQPERHGEAAQLTRKIPWDPCGFVESMGKHARTMFPNSNTCVLSSDFYATYWVHLLSILPPIHLVMDATKTDSFFALRDVSFISWSQASWRSRHMDSMPAPRRSLFDCGTARHEANGGV